MDADRGRAGTIEGRPCCEHAEENARLRRELAEARREVGALRRELATPDGPAEGGGASDRQADAARHPAAAAAGARRAGGGLAHVDQRSSRQEKLALFRTLFAGRADVHARRWENRAKGTSGWWPVHTGGRNTPREAREYLPLTDEVVAAHLEGRDTIGLYPLLADDTCRLLACDFDKAAWRLDAQAYVEAAEAVGMPTAVEVSRSGNGAHVWTFFTAPVSAANARALGAAILREAIALRGELDLDSYDRFFPSQDNPGVYVWEATAQEYPISSGDFNFVEEVINIIDCDEEDRRLHCEIECFLGADKIRDDVQTGSPEDGPAMVAATVDTHPTDSILVTTRWGDGAVSSQWVQSQAAWIWECEFEWDYATCAANAPQTETVYMAHEYPTVGVVNPAGHWYMEYSVLVHVNRPEYVGATLVVSHTC